MGIIMIMITMMIKVPVVEFLEYLYTASEVTTEGGIEMRLLLLLLLLISWVFVVFLVLFMLNAYEQL